VDKPLRNDVLLFSETPGRFIFTVAPENWENFEACVEGMPMACVGLVTEEPDFIVNDPDGKTLIHLPIRQLKQAWKKPFGDLK